jgi:hypothetical protein
MRCGRCNASVADDDRFFSDCGAPLEVACPSCGEPVAVRELLSQYFAAARTVIGRYGGVVEKFIDDAVMAVWGTPVATEGDAERAVRAALDLVARVAELGQEADVPGLAVRAGVVTGEVAVNLGAVQEGMVAGDAVNTAARVQVAAEAMMATLHDLRTSESPDDLMSLDVLEAEVAVARGAPEDALRRARSALAHADTLGLSSMSWTWALAVRAAFELADHAAVRELLAMLDSYPLGHIPPLLRPERELACARLAAADGAQAATTLFASAISGLRRFSTPYHLAHGLLDHAAYLTGLGDAVTAALAVDEAHAIAQRPRCQPLVDRADAIELAQSRVQA